MAYKFNLGLSKLGGQIHMDGNLIVSGSDPKFADKSIEVADLDISNATELADGAVANGDLLPIYDADGDAVKKVAASSLATYFGANAVSFQAVNDALANATGAINVGDNVDITGSMTASSEIKAGVGLVAPRLGHADDLDLLALADGALTVNGTITADAVVSGAAGNFDALAGTSLALQAGGITAAGAIAGATTLAASGLANLDGGIEIDNGGNKFTVSTAGAVVAEGSVSGAAGTFDALAGTSLALQAGGITAAGAIAGATTINASGVVTAGGLTVGSAVMSEADLEQLDDITAGTVAASKAVVVDSNKDADGFRNVTATGLIEAASGSFSGDGIGVHGNVTVTGTIDASAQLIAPQIGMESDRDLMVLTSGKVTINGDLDISGDINRVTTNVTELAIEDINIIIGSGSNASQLDGGGLQFGTSAADVSLAEILFADDTNDRLGTSFAGTEVMRIDAGGDLSLVTDAAVVKMGADGDVSLTHVADTGLLLNSSRQLQFGDDATHIKQVSDGNLELEADTSIIFDSPIVQMEDDNMALAFAGDVTLTHSSGSGLVLATTGQDGRGSLGFGDLTSQISSSASGILDLVANTRINASAPLTASGGVRATNLQSQGYMQVHYDQVSYLDGTPNSGSATNSTSLLAFESGSHLGKTVALSGAIVAGDFPSYVSVAVTGSDTVVFLQLPHNGSTSDNLGSGDAGKVITIKKTNHSSDTVSLVLTGAAAGAGIGMPLFEGSLAALTMSSPDAAVNLMWNGSYYELF